MPKIYLSEKTYRRLASFNKAFDSEEDVIINLMDIADNSTNIHSTITQDLDNSTRSHFIVLSREEDITSDLASYMRVQGIKINNNEEPNRSFFWYDVLLAIINTAVNKGTPIARIIQLSKTRIELGPKDASDGWYIPTHNITIRKMSAFEFLKRSLKIAKNAGLRVELSLQHKRTARRLLITF
ncbi:MAG: hypothetical protein ACON4F_06460 [Candidatus Puniceispirillaceae bacterium]